MDKEWDFKLKHSEKMLNDERIFRYDEEFLNGVETVWSWNFDRIFEWKWDQERKMRGKDIERRRRRLSKRITEKQREV